MQKVSEDSSPHAALETMEEIIKNSPDLRQCSPTRATMICAATGQWHRLADVYPNLVRNPLFALEQLDSTEYMVTRNYYNHRRINEEVDMANDFWDTP